MSDFSARFWTDAHGVEWVEFWRTSDPGGSVPMKVSRLRKEPQWATLEARYEAWKHPPPPVAAKPEPKPEYKSQPMPTPIKRRLYRKTGYQG